MSTFDFDRFKDNNNTYLCKDTQGRQNLENVSVELTKQIKKNATDTDRKLNELKESLKNRYVLIGDSYLDGYTPQGHVNDFGGKLKTMLKCADGDWFQKSKGGTGFVASSEGKTFMTLIDEIYSSVSQPETITHVIFAGGWNDSNYTSENLQSAIASCYAKVMQKFPNATMYTANVASSFDNAEKLWYIHDHVEHAYSYSAINNEQCVHLGYIGNNLHERGMIASDGVHPTDWGQGIIAMSIFYALNGGQYVPVGRFHGFNANYKEGSHNSVVSGFESISKDEVCITIKNVYFHNQETIKCESPWVVGRISDLSYVRSGYDTMCSVQAGAIISYAGGTKFINAPVTIGIMQENLFFVNIHAVNREGDNYETLNNVAYINFNYCTLRVPISYI